MGLPATEKRFTYGDYLRWPEEERWELIEGVAHDMSPAPSRTHQRISLELAVRLRDYFRGRSCELYYAPFDVRLPIGDETDEDIETVVQPDIVVVCDRSKLDERGCRGAPDLVVEILSPHTASKDLKKKLSLYEKHRVRQYWIVQPEHKVVLVFSLGADGRYGRPDVYAAADKMESTLFDGLTIDLAAVFAE